MKISIVPTKMSDKNVHISPKMYTNLHNTCKSLKNSTNLQKFQNCLSGSTTLAIQQLFSLLEAGGYSFIIPPSHKFSGKYDAHSSLTFVVFGWRVERFCTTYLIFFFSFWILFVLSRIVLREAIRVKIELP